MTIETPNSDTTGSNNSTPPPDDNTPKWWIDEGVPGIGERPTWLGEKFKSVADLAKSQLEMEKRLGSPAEAYDFSKSKYLDPEYAPFQELQEFAKSKRVPAEVMDKVLESVDKYMSEFSTDFAEEAQKLGENAKERLTILNNWAKANLSEDSFYALTGQLTTAESIKALEEIRNKMMSNAANVPPGNDDGGKGVSSLEELQAELNNNLDKYKTDPKYRAELKGKIEAAARQSSFVDKAW